MIEHWNDSAGLPEAFGRCSCGWRVTKLFGARRAVDRHVEEQTRLEWMRAQTRAQEARERSTAVTVGAGPDYCGRGICAMLDGHEGECRV